MTLHAKFDLRLIEAQEADDSYKMSGCNCDQRIKHSLKYSSTTCRVPSWPLQLARPFGSLTWLWNWRQGPLNVWALHEQVEHLNCMRDQLLTIAVAQNPFPWIDTYSRCSISDFEMRSLRVQKKNRTGNPYCMMGEYMISVVTGDKLDWESGLYYKSLMHCLWSKFGLGHSEHSSPELSKSCRTN